MDYYDIFAKILLLCITIAVGFVGWYLKGLIGDFKDMQRQQHETDKDVARVQDRLADTEGDLVRVESDYRREVAELAQRIERQDGKLMVIAQDTSGILSRLQAVQEQLNRTESLITDVSQRLSRQEGKQP